MQSRECIVFERTLDTEQRIYLKGQSKMADCHWLTEIFELYTTKDTIGSQMVYYGSKKGKKSSNKFNSFV